MSTDTARPVRAIALPATDAGDAREDTDAARAARYHERIESQYRRYRRRACRNGLAANAVSLLLVATGATVGLSPLLPPRLTAALGVAVILLEGVTRVLRPALRASRARWVTRRLERELRLYDAHGRGYRGDGAEEAFVAAVERILEHANAAEEHDETGTSTESATSRKAG
jgi:hypothetical protein